MRFPRWCGDDVVVVGHSFGGFTIPLVAARRPVRHLVYLCAVVPAIGKSLYEQLADEPEMANLDYREGYTEPDAQLCSRWVDLELLRALFYADCDDNVAQTVFEQLRSQSWYPATLPFSLDYFPCPLHLRDMQRGPLGWPRVGRAGSPRQAGRRTGRASRKSFTAPFTTGSSC